MNCVEIHQPEDCKGHNGWNQSALQSGGQKEGGREERAGERQRRRGVSRDGVPIECPEAEWDVKWIKGYKEEGRQKKNPAQKQAVQGGGR